MSSSKFKRSLMSVAILGATSAFLAACGNTEAPADSQETVDSATPSVVVSPIINVQVQENFNFTDVNAPKATVTGQVFDTNGFAVEGAVVTVAGITATTDSNGHYSIPEVPVVATFAASSVQEFTNKLSDVSLTISVNSTEDFVGARVSVQPFAQFVAPDTTSDLSTLATEFLNSSFVQNLSAPAPNTVVARNTAGVKGKVLDSEGKYGVAGAKVVLDMVKLTVAGNQATHTPAYTVLETGADGSFQFTNIPEDAEFKVYVEGYSVTEGASTTTSTGWEDALHVYVSPKTAQDDVAPFITKIEEVAYTDAGIGRLSDNASNQLNIMFSEKINDAGFNVNSVAVSYKLDGIYNQVDVSPEWLDENLQSVAPGAGSKHLRLTLVSDASGNSFSLQDLPEQADLVIDFLPQDVRDLSGSNPLDVASYKQVKNDNGDMETVVANDGIGYDSKAEPNANAGGAFDTPVTVTLKSFRERIINAAAVESVQPLRDDLSFSQDLAVIQDVNPVFSDVDASSNGIQQLNNSDVAGFESLSAKYLQELLEAQVGPLKLIGESTDVATDVARLRFSAPATGTLGRVFEVRVIEPLRTVVENGVETVTSSTVRTLGADQVEAGLDVNGDPIVPVIGVAKDADQGSVKAVSVSDKVATVTLESGAAEFDLLFKGVEPGFRVEVTSFNDFGRATARAETILEDKIAPITVLQNAYGLEKRETSFSTVTFGQGGEQSQTGEIQLGVPVLPLTPRLLSIVDGSGETDANYVNKFKKLFDLNTVNVESNNTDYSVGEYFIDPSLGVYDDIAFKKFVSNENSAARSSSISIAFSEDIELTGTPDVGDISTVFTNWRALNDIKVNDIGSPFNTSSDKLSEDIVAVDVEDIYSLANEVSALTSYAEQTSYPEIDFAGSLIDESGNAAGEFARVAVADKIPPLIESAVYTGDELKITFDKPVDLEAAIASSESGKVELKITDSAGNNSHTIVIDENEDFTYERGANRRDQSIVVIEEQALGDVDVSSLFDIVTYNSTAGRVIAGTGPNRLNLRGVLEFDQIPNLEGVSWSTYDSRANPGDACNGNCFEPPKFAVENQLEPFAAPVDYSNFTPTSPSAVTFTISFASDADLEALGILDEAGEITETSVASNLITGITDSENRPTTQFKTNTTRGTRSLTVKVELTQTDDVSDGNGGTTKVTRQFFNVQGSAVVNNQNALISLAPIQSKYDSTQVVAGADYKLF